MPYKINKVKGGYKVSLLSGKKMKNGRKYLSKKPMTLMKAKAQKRVVDKLD